MRRRKAHTFNLVIVRVRQKYKEDWIIAEQPVIKVTGAWDTVNEQSTDGREIVDHPERVDLISDVFASAEIRDQLKTPPILVRHAICVQINLERKRALHKIDATIAK